MGIKRKIYFFGNTPLAGAIHLPLQAHRFIDPHLAIADYDYLIVTSKRSLESLFLYGYDLTAIQLYCIGEETARYARKNGLTVRYTSIGYAKDLICEIKPMIEGQKGVYLRPRQVANSYITGMVDDRTLFEAVCYETFCIDATGESVEHPAIFLFAAPSQVECFLKHFSFQQGDQAVAIGQTTFDAIPKNVETSISQEKNLHALLMQAHFLEERQKKDADFD